MVLLTLKNDKKRVYMYIYIYIYVYIYIHCIIDIICVLSSPLCFRAKLACKAAIAGVLLGMTYFQMSMRLAGVIRRTTDTENAGLCMPVRSILISNSF